MIVRKNDYYIVIEIEHPEDPILYEFERERNCKNSCSERGLGNISYNEGCYCLRACYRAELDRDWNKYCCPQACSEFKRFVKEKLGLWESDFLIVACWR